MTILARSVLASATTLVMLAVAAPALSAEAVQIFRCEQEDEATEEDLEANAAKWLAAAQKMEGGQGLKVFLHFPVAVNAQGQTDFLISVVAPSFAEWGVFWDGYQSSAAGDVDAATQASSVCPDSALWQRVEVTAAAE